MNLILIAIAVIVIFIMLKFKEIRHKLGFMVVLFLILFLGLTFWNVYKAHDLDLSTFDGMTQAGKVYFSWLGGLLGNTKAVTTYAIKQDWKINSDVSAPPINATTPPVQTTPANNSNSVNATTNATIK